MLSPEAWWNAFQRVYRETLQKGSHDDSTNNQTQQLARGSCFFQIRPAAQKGLNANEAPGLAQTVFLKGEGSGRNTLPWCSRSFFYPVGLWSGCKNSEGRRGGLLPARWLLEGPVFTQRQFKLLKGVLDCRGGRGERGGDAGCARVTLTLLRSHGATTSTLIARGLKWKINTA